MLTVELKCPGEKLKLLRWDELTEGLYGNVRCPDWVAIVGRDGEARMWVSGRWDRPDKVCSSWAEWAPMPAGTTFTFRT